MEITIKLLNNEALISFHKFIFYIQIFGLSPFAVQLGFLVEEYAAGKGVIPPKKRRKKNSIYIATIEKGLALVRSLIELNRLNELGLIVVSRWFNFLNFNNICISWLYQLTCTDLICTIHISKKFLISYLQLYSNSKKSLMI